MPNFNALRFGIAILFGKGAADSVWIIFPSNLSNGLTVYFNKKGYFNECVCPNKSVNLAKR